MNDRHAPCRYAHTLGQHGYNDLHCVRLLCNEVDALDLMTNKYGFKDGHALKLVRHFCPDGPPIGMADPQAGWGLDTGRQSDCRILLGDCSGPQGENSCAIS